jgi:hypothetical protein
MSIALDGTNGITMPVGSQSNASIVAWANFGYVSSAITLRASYNVTSVTRVGAGEYTINFTNALQDTNFSTLVSASAINGGVYGKFANIVGNTSTTVVNTTTTTTVFVGYTTTLSDEPYISVACIR